MDESSSRSAAPIGFLRRGSGISLRNQSNEDRPSQYNNRPGKSTNLNPVKARFTENKEKPRYLQGPFHSSGSKASSVSSSKAPVRKYHDERQKRPFLAEADIAESSNGRTEVRRLQCGKKAVANEHRHPYTQKGTSGGSSSSTFTEGGLPEEHDLGVLDFSVSSRSSARTIDSGNTALSGMEHRQKDREELSSGRPQGASTFVNRRTVPQSFTTGAKLSSAPGTTSTALQRRGLKSLGCTSISDVLPSGCSSSDSVHNRRVEVTKKRTSDAGSSSRSRGINEQSNLGQPRASLPRPRAAEQSARTNSTSVQDSTDSVRTRRPSTLRARERMPGEREDGVFALRETVTRVRRPERGHFPTDDISPQRLARPFYGELPHAVYSSNRQGSSSRTARRRSPSHPEERPQQMFHGLFGERDGYRHINMEGIAEVLLALDRIEHDDDLTYEQLLVLETNLLLSGLGLHDQHQDMRLDIDNMSYEELLALEEHIGSVSTALTEEQFAKCINQSVYEARNSDRDGNNIEVDDVKCSICQEEYVEGEEIGRMQCEHQYHVCCIHEWLRQKNWCPICKASAIPSEVDKGDA
ncbi:hypothetical protein SETIT_4G247100v2 [Setaria italica]|uniref:RING-type E3 ubiquitin transferase n=1 Tax=Setaria italica TaxID=4555 RepID=K3XW24_SETIT|nr:E3 ubiquitin-protein ligase MBR2 [Setaria italica]RCV22772.1 hypothetical protein SETIT_4G247100v2 [Setaria italica]